MIMEQVVSFDLKQIFQVLLPLIIIILSILIKKHVYNKSQADITSVPLKKKEKVVHLEVVREEQDKIDATFSSCFSPDKQPHHNSASCCCFILDLGSNMMKAGCTRRLKKKQKHNSSSSSREDAGVVLDAVSLNDEDDAVTASVTEEEDEGEDKDDEEQNVRTAVWEPSVKEPSVIGTIRSTMEGYLNKQKMMGGDSRRERFGSDAMEERHLFNVHYPIEDKCLNKKVEKFDARIKELIGHACDRVSMNRDRTLMTKSDTAIISLFDSCEPDLCSKICQEVFEVNDRLSHIDRIIFASQHSLALFSVGLTSGLSLNVGSLDSSIVPIYECYKMNHLKKSIPIGGTQLNDILGRLISAESNSSVHLQPTSTGLELLKQMKEKLCFVSKSAVTSATVNSSNNNNAKNQKMESFVLPDGVEVKLTFERYSCPEFLFNPQFESRMFSMKTEETTKIGLCELTMNAITELKEQYGKELESVYSNLVVFGGTTRFLGFSNRFCKDLNTLLLPSQQEVNVYMRKEGQDMPYLGAHTLFQLSDRVLNGMAISRNDFNDMGPSVVQRKLLLL